MQLIASTQHESAGAAKAGPVRALVVASKAGDANAEFTYLKLKSGANLVPSATRLADQNARHTSREDSDVAELSGDPHAGHSEKVRTRRSEDGLGLTRRVDREEQSKAGERPEESPSHGTGNEKRDALVHSLGKPGEDAGGAGGMTEVGAVVD